MRITVGSAVVIVIFLISMSMTLATWKAEMVAEHKEFDDRISHVGDKIVNMRHDINDAKTEGTLRDIELAKINTKLASIEALLIDIKADLKSHQG